MKTIIVSGFRRFGAYRCNPTETLVEYLAGETLAGYRVITALFDATIPTDDRGANLLFTAYQFDACAIISLGVDSQKRGLCIEREAKNLVLNAKYCPPELQNTPVDATRPFGEKLELDENPWRLRRFERLCSEESIPVEISHDAGGFCCNHLAYQVCAAQNRGILRTMPFVFVHVPCSPESIPDIGAFVRENKTTMTIPTMEAGLKNLLIAARFA